jgi:hypothetical protein
MQVEHFLNETFLYITGQRGVFEETDKKIQNIPGKIYTNLEF